MDARTEDQPASSDPFAWRWRVALGVVVLVALLVRGVLLAQSLRSPSLDDPDHYLPLARSLAEGRGLALYGKATAYRPPLYPLVLAPIVAVLGARTSWGVAGLHLALGAGTVLLTASAARGWRLSPRATIVAAAIVACDPVLVAQSRSVMTETLAAFLTAATLAVLTRSGASGAFLGGLAFGLGALCRPSLLPGAVLTAFALVLIGPGSRRNRMALALVLLSITAALLAPWALRNQRVIGAPVFTTSHGGYTLYLANNPVYYDEVVNGPPGTVWTGPNQGLWWASISQATRGMTELQADRAMRTAALRVIIDRPRDFARASLARLGRFWGLAPAGAVYPRWLRLATAAWTVPLWLGLALGIMSGRIGVWPRVAAPAIILALMAVHTIYWTDLRMRAPIVPAIALIAASPNRKNP